MTTMRRVYATWTAAFVVAAIGCGDPAVTQPRSLEAPTSAVAVDGEVCLPNVVRDDATIGTDPLPACTDGGNGFGLVVNERSHRLGVAALGQRPARLVNTDARRPGITHIRTGSRPVDVTTSGDGTAAVVANQVDETLTGVDLWTLRPLQREIELEGTPKRVASLEGDDGWATAVLTAVPNRLELAEGLECTRPDIDDRRDYRPTETCQWQDPGPRRMELPGRPVDMAVDDHAGRAWVIYRDMDAMSWVALNERGLGDDECTQPNAQPPCEIDRIGWESASGNWGATRVDADPVGMFVYVLDRADRRLMVFDRQRRELIDASEAMEPPLQPIGDQQGMSVLRSSTAMTAEVRRQVVDDGHTWYQFGARIASQDGRLYEVAAMEMECLFDGTALESTGAFLFDDQRREASDEAVCLRTPEFPLGGNPDLQDDEELLDHRIIETDDASLAYTPVFGPVDGSGQESRIVGRAECVHPDELREAIADAADDDVTGCGSPLVPQPVADGVPDDLDTYADVERADLMQFAFAWFEAGQPAIARSTYDLRVVDEEWSVTYEGPIPNLGDRGRGLVDADDGSVFLSGGANFCESGVSEGDRVTILTAPRDASECQIFDDGEESRTWGISSRGAFDLQLEVLDGDDGAERLPSRNCFDRGVRYEVRPVDEWVVAGDQSGMTSRYETSDEECVLREGADEPQSRIQGRVETGGEYFGPYLSFRIREAPLQPVRGTRYTFNVQRNFSVASENHIPDERSTSLPSRVGMFPDLGAGRLVTVVDAGGNRVFTANPAAPGTRRGFLQ